MPRLKQFDVFLDGGCAFCQRARARMEPFDTHGRLNFLDYNDPAVGALAPFTREELDREIHVRAPDGSWYTGFAAWVALLRVMPFLSWLGTLLGSAIFRTVGPKLYRWVARNRHRLPGSPPAFRADVSRTQPSIVPSDAEGPSVSTPGRSGRPS